MAFIEHPFAAWASSFARAVLVLALATLGGCTPWKTQQPSRPTAEIPHERVLVIILDGTQEALFRSLLDQGQLPHMGKLLERDAEGKRHAVYTPATSVWPSTTGPAYAPFVTGNFPRKAELAGIRQYLRELMVFRSYAGTDAFLVSDDLSKQYPTLYEVLGREETFNQAGLLSRRGWDDPGRAIHPLHENLSSTPALIHGTLLDIGTGDLYNALSFINYVSPEFDTDRLRAAYSFEGRFYAWNTPMATLRLAYEDLFSVMGFERVVRELNLSARKLGGLPAFSFLTLHLPDNTGHRVGTGPEYAGALQRVDEIVGFMLEVFRHQGILKHLTLIVTSDHGMSPVDRQFPVIPRLAADAGVPIRDSIKTMTDEFNVRWRGTLGSSGEQIRWAGIGAVSGNAHVQIYMRKPGSSSWSERPTYEQLRAYPSSASQRVDLIEVLLGYPEVAHVFVAVDRKAREFRIFTSAGQAAIHVHSDEGGAPLYRYQVLRGRDPLGYSEDSKMAALIRAGRAADGDLWAALSRHTQFPDGIVQIVQLLETPTAGDLVLDAAPGVEPWDQGQAGVHGALRREQMVVPLLISSPRLDVAKAESLFASGRMPRTVDLYASVLELLGEHPPGRISWIERRWLGLRRTTRSASVRTDVDGVALDIWKSLGTR